MRFNEWRDKLLAQQQRLNDLALGEVFETISVEGKGVCVTFGKAKCEIAIDGNDYGANQLRSLYTHNKEEFHFLLESITESTDRVVTATKEILLAVSAEAIPMAVIERMKGEQTSGDPADLVRAMTEKKLNDLLKSLEKRVSKQGHCIGKFQSFQITLEKIREVPLILHFMAGVFQLNWGNISAGAGRVAINDAEQAMFFIANYEYIKERLFGFLDKAKNI